MDDGPIKVVRDWARAAIRLCALLVVLGAAPAFAQDAKLQFDSLDKLAAKADNVIDINIDEQRLELLRRALPGKDPTEAKIKEVIAGLKGIYVKRLEFDADKQYSDSDIDVIRAQLRAPAWSKVVGVHSKRSGENVEVYILDSAGKILGLSIIYTEAKELTFVNIVGSVDPEKIMELSKYFGMPGFELDKSAKPRKE